ncbi:hypothetical protein GJ744_007464 [Endocarpon pusillum]|uniref:INO80 complex subunit 4 n=1 Tax=Endocarpon pusillum TaxID=364733 RepID=A0A8H7E438_9EURO|nr:hypothetical protein GJ744_007464 [Endocarpon pusillum]
MSASSSTTISTPAQNARPDKTNKPSKIVVFKVSPEKLGRFMPKPTPRKNSKAKSTPSSVSTPTSAPAAASALAPASSPNGDASESNSTPVPGATEAPKKKGTGARAGTKRALDGAAKSRGKPGPKKKPRLEDGTLDPTGKPIGGGGGAVTNGTHKLGPKANQGAINAGLRALDRSGKPCRKWERKPIQLKSFTGVVWELPSWRAPKSKLPNEESQESKDASQPSGSKANDSSTAMDSEKSNAGENGTRLMMESTPAASSPVPAPLLASVAATG